VISKRRGHNPIGYTILIWIAPIFFPLVLLLQKTDQQKLLETNRYRFPDSPAQEIDIKKEKVFRVLESANLTFRRLWDLLWEFKMDPSLNQFIIKTVVIAAAAAVFYYALSPYERCVRRHGEDLRGWCGEYNNW
jgi:hypothetical protein